MAAKTDRQLEGVKKRANATPQAVAAKAETKRNSAGTRAATATKAVRTSKQTRRNRTADGGTPVSESPQRRAASKADSMAGFEVNVTAQRTGNESLEKDGGASGSDGIDAPVKPLTEAGKKRLVNRLLGLADAQATRGSFKITPADLIRLMQLHREMNPQKDRKVTVQWIEDKPE
jgi:hypothetical protein